MASVRSNSVLVAALVALAGGCSTQSSHTPAWTLRNGTPAPAAPESAARSDVAQPGEPTEFAQSPASEDSDAGNPDVKEADPRRRGMASFQATGELPPALNVSRATFSDEGADFDPAPSRDGSRLFFASTSHREASDIYVKRRDSRVTTRLTNDPADDAMPCVSPDGQHVAFASNRAGNWDIYAMSSDGGKAVQITDDPGDDLHPSWSPDGRQLIFSHRGERDGRWEMWVTQVSNPSVSHFVGEGLFPSWCPVAGGESGPDRILFQLPRERGRRNFTLWTLDLIDGKAGNITEIASSATSALIAPAWSPDGKWVVFAEVPAPAPGERPETRRVRESSLWMVSTTGDARVRLTGNEATAMAPAFAGPSQLYFVSTRGGVENSWSMDISQAIASASATIGASPALASGSAQGAGQSSQGHSADNTPVAAAAEGSEAPGTSR